MKLSVNCLLNTDFLFLVFDSIIEKIPAGSICRDFFEGFAHLFCFLSVLRSLRVAHILHGASRATASARGFSLFLIAAHFKNDEHANDDQNEGNDDGCKILRKKVKHGNTSFGKMN